MPSQTTVGFVGVGHMGAPMAQRLHDAGYRVVVLDSNPENSEAFVRKNQITSAKTGADLAPQCSFIITMLPNSSIVQSVITGDQGILATMQEGTIILEMSSGVPSQTRQIEAAVRKCGGHLLDAPVSGGVSRATTGDLSIMVGGTPNHVEIAKPVLSCMGSSVIHTGAVGTAHAMKALNNLLSAGGFLLGIEALIIGQQFGLEPEVMVDVFNSSTGMNNSTQKKFKQFVLSRKFNSGFSMDLMLKDLSIALGIADDVAASTPMSSLCKDLWTASTKTVGGQHDHTAAARLLEQLNDTELHAGSR